MVILVRMGENDAGNLPSVLPDNYISRWPSLAIETIDNNPAIGRDSEQYGLTRARTKREEIEQVVVEIIGQCIHLGVNPRQWRPHVDTNDPEAARAEASGHRSRRSRGATRSATAFFCRSTQILHTSRQS